MKKQKQKGNLNFLFKFKLPIEIKIKGNNKKLAATRNRNGMNIFQKGCFTPPRESNPSVKIRNPDQLATL